MKYKFALKYVAFALAIIGIGAAGCSVQPARAASSEFQRGLDSVGAQGGGTYLLVPGATVTTQQTTVVPEGVTLDLNGGRIVATLSEANDAGVRLLSGSALVNGTVVVRSRGRPGTQGGAHAAVLIGSLYGENPAVGRISPFSDPRGWRVSGVTLSTDKSVSLGEGLVVGAPAIQVMGGAHDGLIENVTVPDSPAMAGGVHLDWGTVGPITSDNVQANAAAYRRGQAYTTHPHDIRIRNLRVGRLTRRSLREQGTFGVRLSGVRDVVVENVTIASTTEAAFAHTAGDLGFEFALGDDRARAHRGIVIDGLRSGGAGAYLIRSDSYADNVGRAVEQGYRPMLQPIAQTDIVVKNVVGAFAGGGGGGPGFGVRVDHQRGGTFADISVSGFRRGFFIDEQVYDLELLRPSAIDSGEAAISVEHPYRPPARVTISDARAAGRGPFARTMIIGTSDAVKVLGSGLPSVRVSTGARNVRLPPGIAILRD